MGKESSRKEDATALETSSSSQVNTLYLLLRGTKASINFDTLALLPQSVISVMFPQGIPRNRAHSATDDSLSRVDSSFFIKVNYDPHLFHFLVAYFRQIADINDTRMSSEGSRIIQDPDSKLSLEKVKFRQQLKSFKDKLFGPLSSNKKSKQIDHACSEIEDPSFQGDNGFNF